MAGDPRWRTVGQVGPNRPRPLSGVGHYQPPLDPRGDDVPALDLAALWKEHSTIQLTLATVVHSEYEERLLVRRLEAIAAELERRRGVS
jgi:hypothetical protein